MTARARVLLGAAVGGLFAAAAHGQSISIDWFGGGGGGGTTQVQMGLTETAGIIPLSNWNSFTPNTQAVGQALVDSTNAATGATVTWTSANTWNTNHVQSPGDSRMMKGYIDTNDTSITTVGVTGLPAALAAVPYSVIVYYDGDNGTENRVGRYSITGATTGNATLWGRDAGGVFSGIYSLGASPFDPLAGGGAIDSNNTAALTVPAGNFMIFTGLTGSAFTLSAQASVSAGGTNRAAVQGIQIVPGNVPEPGSLTVLGLAASGLMLRRRKA